MPTEPVSYASEYGIATPDRPTADMFVGHARLAGAREPRFIAAHANLLAASGSIEALERPRAHTARSRRFVVR